MGQIFVGIKEVVITTRELIVLMVRAVHGLEMVAQAHCCGRSGGRRAGSGLVELKAVALRLVLNEVLGQRSFEA